MSEDVKILKVAAEKNNTVEKDDRKEDRFRKGKLQKRKREEKPRRGLTDSGVNTTPNKKKKTKKKAKLK